MKIYTKKGDAGETGLIGGGRVSKADPVIEVLGNLDELNASLGRALVHGGASASRSVLQTLQSVLFDLGAEVASTSRQYEAAGLPGLTESLEDWIDEKTAQMPELRSFVLPGGTMLAAELHMARAVCRRLERSLVVLSAEKALRSELLVFVNRLSDWLFCAARYANHEAGVEDAAWTGDR